MRKLYPVVSLLGALCLSPLPAQSRDCLVLSAVPADDPFAVAAKVLADRHHAEVVQFDVADLEPLRPVLATAEPRHVAIVLRPEQLDFALQRRMLQLATEIDDDPFVDFAFGYVTGRDAGDAVALAKRSSERAPRAAERGVATMAGGVRVSMSTHRGFELRAATLPGVQFHCAGDEAFPDTGRDLTYLRRHLPELGQRDAVEFVGHGMPREVVGGPTFAELAGIDLGDTVVLNVACYTGVTRRWFDEDYRAGVVRVAEVPLAESFCLAVLHAGVVGYTAYLCPRPAGPELSTDLAALLADGASLGDARRRDYDKTVLGFLGFGEPRLALEPPQDGQPIAHERGAVRDMMLEGATGGVLFGDPACVPFVALPGKAPVQLACTPGDGAIVVEARVAGGALYLQCADPTAEWGSTMAMKVHARVPLGDRFVTDVVVDELKVGREQQPSRVLWAVERDHGERFLQLKVNFPRSDRLRGELRLVARIATTADPAAGRDRGGEVQRVRQAVRDVKSREAAPFLVEVAAVREVSTAALQAALDASASLLGDAAVEPGALDRLAAFDSEGFRAVCALLEVGQSHYRTQELLRATWRPGDERHLLALASGPELPNFASWQVLEGLACADTPAVRGYLRERLTKEQDPGLFMATALGLAALGDGEAIAPIVDVLVAERAGWQGVEAHLVHALAKLGPGGREALARLGESELRCAEAARAAVPRQGSHQGPK